MVSATIRRIVSPCWRPSDTGEISGRHGDSSGRVDGLLWYKDSGRHAHGEFSMAVIQANKLLEDQSQLESGPLSLTEGTPVATFVGIYDGHGGPEASRFVNDSLFKNIKSEFFFTLHHKNIINFVFKIAMIIILIPKIVKFSLEFVNCRLT